ncbi:MAG: hypothetical protein NTW57_01845 [Methylophilales bacterium]|nr:hypothetical protein [Methylophilales bacterium]
MNSMLQQPVLSKELRLIAAEVSKHGLYTVKLDTFIVNASNREEIVSAVHSISKQAQLKVHFDFELGECTFERE